VKDLTSNLLQFYKEWQKIAGCPLRWRSRNQCLFMWYPSIKFA